MQKPCSKGIRRHSATAQCAAQPVPAGVPGRFGAPLSKCLPHTLRLPLPVCPPLRAHSAWQEPPASPLRSTDAGPAHSVVAPAAALAAVSAPSAPAAQQSMYTAAWLLERALLSSSSSWGHATVTVVERSVSTVVPDAPPKPAPQPEPEAAPAQAPVCPLKTVIHGSAVMRGSMKPDMQDRHVLLPNIAMMARRFLDEDAEPEPDWTHSTVKSHNDMYIKYRNRSAHYSMGRVQKDSSYYCTNGNGGCLQPYQLGSAGSTGAARSPVVRAKDVIYEPNCTLWQVPTSVVAVFDGHSGSRTSRFSAFRIGELLAECTPLWTALAYDTHTPKLEGPVVSEVVSALQRIFIHLDDEILEVDKYKPPGEFDGTTALLGLQVGQHLFMANVGDTRAVLSRDGQAVRLSRDHTPDLEDERLRIETAGGYVRMFRGTWRLVLPMGPGAGLKICAVSRSLGDVDYKLPNPYMSCVPDVYHWPLQPSHDRFVVYASDGVWVAMTDQQAVDFVQQALDRAFEKGATPAEAAREASTQLIAYAAELGSTDDITAVVSLLSWNSMPDASKASQG